jgi:hypothetical protein
MEGRTIIPEKGLQESRMIFLDMSNYLDKITYA